MKDKLTNHIKPARVLKGLTQAQLAERVQVSRKTINVIENGKFVPSTVLALRLATVLDTPVEVLFELEE